MRFHNSPPVIKSKKLSTKLFGLCSDESIISHWMILNRYSLFCVYDLMSIDELSVLDGGKCILQLRGVRPFLSDKYDLTQHPNYKYTSDYDSKNAFDIEKFLNHKLKLKPNDVYEVVDVG